MRVSDHPADESHAPHPRRRPDAARRSAGRSVEAIQPQNRVIAARLREAADLLFAQHADPARVRAYRAAADAVLRLGEELGEMAPEAGRVALEALPGIQPSTASAIAEMLRSGRWSLLERLRGSAEPERLLQMIPGVGPQLARRLQAALQVDTLEALEAAVRDGRLDQVPGLGERRGAMLRKAVADLMSRVRIDAPTAEEEPSVAVLLDIDREYREKAAAGLLPQIPAGEAKRAGDSVVPVLHARRDPWYFTAIYASGARGPHGHADDAVLIYFHSERNPEAQRTVAGERRGPLAGRRVVRGREAACSELFGQR
jgi:hypothetical protein